MLTLLSMLGGGLFRLLPEILKLFTAKQDAAHEYRMTMLQLEIDRERAKSNLDMVHAQGQINQNLVDMQAMMTAMQEQGRPSGIRWVDAMSSSVRPVLTYWWCMVLYTIAKLLTLYIAVTSDLPLTAIVVIIVTPFDEAIIGSIFAFWFVDRSLRKQGRIS